MPADGHLNETLTKEQGAKSGDAQPQWGITAQTGVLTDVLLGKPDFFEWTKLNAISDVAQENQERMGYVFDKQKAMRQHRQMVDIYEANGVRCHFVEADEGLKASVFTRDSSFMTPWGAVVASIQTPPRRRDYAVVSEFYRNAGIPIWKWVTAGHFEGGDFVILKPGVALLGYSGSRSTKEGAEQVAGWIRDKGWEVFVVPIPHQFVHMDAVVVMLEKGLALICEDALPAYALEFIKTKHGIKSIRVEYADCVQLGGNLVSLGNKRVLSMAHNLNVNARLKDEGFEVFAVDYDMFALGGGGVHCSCHELRRLPE
ncbi:dimethylarginine dimethylaminohydrolase family protein [Hyphomicrobium facile]|uniref:arginine deiminase n=1 Tax=Hyphomicrobium facile TaxID=51670 RepID=A0A1I7NK12_9HYPH|nr:arginine deiminase family protein [Hyphomicrobium facile]SFV35011.1 N-Dimethylarginine dimethylaminohydrolase [Hyphomicrobium facile]